MSVRSTTAASGRGAGAGPIRGTVAARGGTAAVRGGTVAVRGGAAGRAAAGRVVATGRGTTASAGVLRGQPGAANNNNQQLAG